MYIIGTYIVKKVTNFVSIIVISRKKSMVEKSRKVGRFLTTDRKVGRSIFGDRPQTLIWSSYSNKKCLKEFEAFL